MAELRPFHGLRYTAADVSTLLAPPFDVVSAATQASLIEQDPHNILVVDNPAGTSVTAPAVYASAGDNLRAWMRDRVLERDSDSSFYIVRHDFPNPTDAAPLIRTGIIGLLPALPWEESEVRPHEKTFKGPKQDRMELMRATGAQTSPIFVMWDGAAEIGGLIARLTERGPVARGYFAGDVGQEEVQLWRISEPADVASISGAFSAARLYIADGHHRYETVVSFAEGQAGVGRQRPGVLTYLADAQDPGIVLLATHRLVGRSPGLALRTPAEAGSQLGPDWSWVALDGRRLSAELQSTDRGHLFVVGTGTGLFVFSRETRETSSPKEGLDVSILHEELMPAFGIGPSSSLSFVRDPEAALASVQSSDAVAAFLMRPPSVKDVTRVADAGETMPQKSTYFYPKVPTGLVLYGMEVA